MSNLKITEYSGEEINQEKIDEFWETQDDDSMLVVDYRVKDDESSKSWYFIN